MSCSTCAFPSHGAVPDSLALSEFARIMTAFSEAPGHFPGDNFVTNESSYLHVVPAVIKLGKRGGVYIGVGTEQNFSYIAASRPDIAFIVDIRRENLLQHLLYKGLFALARDRSSFLMLLFSRQDPGGRNRLRTDDRKTRPPFRKSWITSSRRPRPTPCCLKKTGGGFGVKSGGMGSKTGTILDKMLYIYRSFYEKQLSIRYAETRLGNGLFYPTFRDLMSGTTKEGEYASFLSTEDAFGFVKRLHLRNLIIPVVGNFAGGKALRAIGTFAEAHDTSVSVFLRVERRVLPHKSLLLRVQVVRRQCRRASDR